MFKPSAKKRKICDVGKSLDADGDDGDADAAGNI